MSTMSRRQFLAASATAAAAPLIVPSRVLGQPGPNDQISIGCIGLGGMGNSHRSWFTEAADDARVVALCDVDTERLAAAADWYEDGEVDTYTDFRHILDRDDIDAVVFGTPDHWHAVQTVMACQAGKDVYVEKPTSNSIAESQAMIRATREHNRIVQVGSQGRALNNFPSICEFIRSGQLGRITEVDCWHYANPEGGDAPEQTPPDHLDWDMWLGPARWRPYHANYAHGTFRWFLDFGGGNIRDRGAHVLNVLCWFLDLDNTGPTKITAKGRPPSHGNYDNPVTMDVTWEFAHRDLVVHWRQPGIDPNAPGQERPYGGVYHGTNGSLVVDGGDIGGRAWPLREAEEFEAPEGERMLRVEGHGASGNRRNWLDCIRSREEPIMPIEAGHRIASMCILGNLAYRLGRTLEFDPETERVLNDEEANRHLHEPGRGPWHV